MVSSAKSVHLKSRLKSLKCLPVKPTGCHPQKDIHNIFASFFRLILVTFQPVIKRFQECTWFLCFIIGSNKKMQLRYGSSLYSSQEDASNLSLEILFFGCGFEGQVSMWQYSVAFVPLININTK